MIITGGALKLLPREGPGVIGQSISFFARWRRIGDTRRSAWCCLVRLLMARWG